MKVGELMTSQVITIGPQEPIAAAARLMKRHNLGALPVCGEDGKLRGILTDRDIVTRCVAAEMDPNTRIREIMSRGVRTCGADQPAGEAARIMSDEQIRRLPVLSDGRLAGMVSLCDLARSEACAMEAAEALGEISENIRRC